MADYMCAYGNCDNMDTPIVVSCRGNPGDRVRFCCEKHAALYLLKRRLSLADLDEVTETLRRQFP
jgi:hypothetical protein